MNESRRSMSLQRDVLRRRLIHLIRVILMATEVIQVPPGAWSTIVSKN